MREITNQFKRDDKKRSLEKGIDAMMDHMVELPAVGQTLKVKFRDLALKGKYAGCRRCHLKLNGS